MKNSWNSISAKNGFMWTGSMNRTRSVSCVAWHGPVWGVIPCRSKLMWCRAKANLNWQVSWETWWKSLHRQASVISVLSVRLMIFRKTFLQNTISISIFRRGLCRRMVHLPVLPWRRQCCLLLQRNRGVRMWQWPVRSHCVVACCQSAVWKKNCWQQRLQVSVPYAFRPRMKRI